MEPIFKAIPVMSLEDRQYDLCNEIMEFIFESGLEAMPVIPLESIKENFYATIHRLDIERNVIKDEAIMLEETIKECSASINDYINSYKKYRNVPDSLKPRFDGLIEEWEEAKFKYYKAIECLDEIKLRRERLKIDYQSRIDECRRNKIAVYENQDRNDYSPEYEKLPDISCVTENGIVRFDEQAILNGKIRDVRVPDFNKIGRFYCTTKVKSDSLANRNVVSPCVKELFEMIAFNVPELSSTLAACRAAIETNIQQPKSILKRRVEVRVESFRK